MLTGCRLDTMYSHSQTCTCICLCTPAAICLAWLRALAQVDLYNYLLLLKRNLRCNCLSDVDSDLRSQTQRLYALHHLVHVYVPDRSFVVQALAPIQHDRHIPTWLTTLLHDSCSVPSKGHLCGAPNSRGKISQSPFRATGIYITTFSIK